MYEKTNQSAEKISKLIELAIVYVSLPGFILPKTIYSYFMYFTSDLGADAFVLSIPAW